MASSIRIRPGDNVESRVTQILRQFSTGGKNQVVTLTNSDPACQKMISILELAKQRILEESNEPFHQYNKMDYEVSSKPPKKLASTLAETPEMPAGLDKKIRTEFIYPRLTIKLSHTSLPLTEEEGWYHQKVA